MENVAGIGLSIISFLGIINVWFIIRLVKKIDFSSTAIIQLQTTFELEMRHMTEKIQHLGGLHERVSTMEQDLAILKFVAQRHHPETLSRA